MEVKKFLGIFFSAPFGYAEEHLLMPGR